MNLKEEEIRWKDVIEQYKSEIGMTMANICADVVEGNKKANKEIMKIGENDYSMSQKGLNLVGMSLNIFDTADYELDFMACHAIYAHKYKNRPTEDSLEILKKMLKTTNIPKSE